MIVFTSTFTDQSWEGSTMRENMDAVISQQRQHHNTYIHAIQLEILADIKFANFVQKQRDLYLAVRRMHCIRYECVWWNLLW